MTKLFISHSSEDDEFVRNLRAALADQGLQGWIDSRELRGGDPLWPEIQRRIEAAGAFAVVVSPAALQSRAVGKELRYALDLSKRRGRGQYPVVPLALNGTKLGVLEEIFGDEPLYIPVSSAAGGIEMAMNAILVALGQRLPAEVACHPQPKAQPMEDLVLELTDLRFHEQDNKRRASASARLVYEPAAPGQPRVHSVQPWRLIVPLGPVETEELSWYLEKYPVWPSPYFRDRARNVEKNLLKWGQLLHEAAMPLTQTSNVMNAWAKIGSHVGRRFSVHVDAALEAGAPETEAKIAHEAATELLQVPWELLHDGDSYLFQGAMPTRVRRRLPNTQVLDLSVVATPIRILVVTARPEDESCSYLDHRASALPLVEAMEALPGLVEIHVLNPPTLPVLREELDRAREAAKPYHVVHFDGHGIYDKRIGLGGLCFEHPDDVDKLEKRRHITIFTKDSVESGIGLGPLLRGHRIPLIFLDACQSSRSNGASESVASELLKVGVASVVAMSHSVLVETTSRFVECFYSALAQGKRVADAMLAAQRRLKDDTSRGRTFGAQELRLEDWFVPVLFQEKNDPQLFTATSSMQVREDFQAALTARLGDLPQTPATGFIGRSRELLALQRLLLRERYAVVRGQGGEGKTALAAEFARWMVRSHQARRAAFVSLETHGNESAIVDALGKQLVDKKFFAAAGLGPALQEIERALAGQRTVLVFDYLESILPLPWPEASEAITEDGRELLRSILGLFSRVGSIAETRIVITSREPVPVPFDGERNQRELGCLDRTDAVRLIERVLDASGDDVSTIVAASREEIEALVDTVQCHARTLSLLAPSLKTYGVEKTRRSLVELMIDMDRRFPGNREKSLFASVELSLRRMSPQARARANALGVFHGVVNLGLLRAMTEWSEVEIASLGDELVAIGLARRYAHNHLALNPALCPYLYQTMDASQRDSLSEGWLDTMSGFINFLSEELHSDIELSSSLTILNLPNLMAAVGLLQRSKDAERVIDMVTSLHLLLQNSGRRRLLELLWNVRETASKELESTWSGAMVAEESSRISQLLAEDALEEAVCGARQLLNRVRRAGEDAYAGADFDLAMACHRLASLLHRAGGVEEAFPLLEEAFDRFQSIELERPGGGSARMVAVTKAARAECLVEMGQFDQAAAAYEDAKESFEKNGATRDVIVAQVQLGSLHLRRRHYPAALAAFVDGLKKCELLADLGLLLTLWHQMGVACYESGRSAAAEDAYLKALAIAVQTQDVTSQAATLGQLGLLYMQEPDRHDEAINLIRQSAEKYADLHDGAREGLMRANLAVALCHLDRLDEARCEIQRAIACNAPHGHAAHPWRAWDTLATIEAKSNDPTASSKARAQAIESFLAYRRDGGENQMGSGRIVLDTLKQLHARGADSALGFLRDLAASPELEESATFIRAVEAIIAGSRDREIAAARDLDYQMAAELLLLVESLEEAR